MPNNAATDLHVCHIISSFRPLVGGAERATETLCSRLVEQGVDVVVLTRHHTGLPRFEYIARIPVHRLGVGGPRWFRSLTFVAHILLWLCLRLRRYPIVHVQNIDAPLVAGLLARTLLRRKLVVTLQGEQQIIMRQAMPLGGFRVRLMVRLAGRFVAITGESHRQYLKEGVDPRRICDIPNGIDSERFSPPTPQEKQALRGQLGLPHRVPIVVFAGRLIPLKRVDALLEACNASRAVTPFLCLIVGDGPERTRLERLAHDLGLPEGVRFVGQAPDVRPYYQAADLFVLPSTREGLSVALLEAMACGLCPLVSGLPGNQELVQHGVNGLAFPPHQPGLLSTRLAEVLGDPDLRRQLGQAARDTIERGFSAEGVAARHRDLYEQLV